ncbi:MAG TPA: NAD(P)-dependent oxidoreductase [Rhodocyclaceae bacterium]|nr:NAD(P)-dependent oxidoreductase [Rhodocyclaceae bacterium]
MTLLYKADPERCAVWARQFVEYATLAVLAAHRDWLRYVAQQREGVWNPIHVRTAGSRWVGVLGMGVLGQAVLTRLHGLGFQCAAVGAGLPGIESYAGEEGLDAMLGAGAGHGTDHAGRAGTGIGGAGSSASRLQVVRRPARFAL